MATIQVQVHYGNLVWHHCQQLSEVAAQVPMCGQCGVRNNDNFLVATVVATDARVDVGLITPFLAKTDHFCKFTRCKSTVYRQAKRQVYCRAGNLSASGNDKPADKDSKDDRSGKKGILQKHNILCLSEPVIATERRGAHGHRAYVVGESGELKLVKSMEVRSPLEQLTDFFRGLLLPQGYSSLGSDYWQFSIWHALRNVVSSAMAVLATRSLLLAVGVGASHAAAASATINWVLKDGLGRIGCIIAVAIVGNRFDNEPKTFFFAGDVIYEIGLGIEIITPLLPHLFLITASIANAAKTISYMMRLPPRAAILKSFSRRENLGDVSAKANSQEVLSSLVGMAIGIQLSRAVGHSVAASLACYVVTLATVMFCSYKSLARLKLNTLNWQRTEILARHYVRTGEVPHPSSVNKMERMWPLGLPAEMRVARWQCTYGAPLHATCETQTEFNAMRTLYKKEEYLLSCHWNPSQDKSYISVSANAKAGDILKSVLQAEYLQQHRGCPIEESYQYTCAHIDRFLQGLSDNGWVAEHIVFTAPHIADWGSHARDEMPQAFPRLSFVLASLLGAICQSILTKPDDVSGACQGDATWAPPLIWCNMAAQLVSCLLVLHGMPVEVAGMHGAGWGTRSLHTATALEPWTCAYEDNRSSPIREGHVGKPTGSLARLLVLPPCRCYKEGTGSSVCCDILSTATRCRPGSARKSLWLLHIRNVHMRDPVHTAAQLMPCLPVMWLRLVQYAVLCSTQSNPPVDTYSINRCFMCIALQTARPKSKVAILCCIVGHHIKADNQCRPEIGTIRTYHHACTREVRPSAEHNPYYYGDACKHLDEQRATMADMMLIMADMTAAPITSASVSMRVCTTCRICVVVVAAQTAQCPGPRRTIWALGQQRFLGNGRGPVESVWHNPDMTTFPASGQSSKRCLDCDIGNRKIRQLQAKRVLFSPLFLQENVVRGPPAIDCHGPSDAEGVEYSLLAREMGASARMHVHCMSSSVKQAGLEHPIVDLELKSHGGAAFALDKKVLSCTYEYPGDGQKVSVYVMGAVTNIDEMVELYALGAEGATEPPPVRVSDTAELLMALYLNGFSDSDADMSLQPATCLDALQGDFAFMLYDAARSYVLAARSAQHPQPFFWGTALSDGAMLFSTSESALEECGPHAAGTFEFPQGCLFESTEADDFGALKCFKLHGVALKTMQRINSQGQLCGAMYKVPSSCDMCLSRDSSLNNLAEQWAH
eukprot:jgi/Mesvir1/28457/Mv15880-RA.1